MLVAVVHAGNVQDRDGAVQVFRAMGRLFPWLENVFADGAYSGAKLHAALKPLCGGPLEIVKRSDQANGFKVIPIRWVVERTFAWLSCNRRLAKDFESRTANATAYLYVALIKLMTRRIARA